MPIGNADSNTTDGLPWQIAALAEHRASYGHELQDRKSVV
jgi:hypothetical protein